MIRPIDIRLNAAHPELPLVEAVTFIGSPSTVLIRGVPKAVGNWSITAVNVAVTYPDNSTTTRSAVESAEGVWVATIPGTATSGRTTAGFRILADGIDENGAAVTGYVLGFADFSVLSFTPVPAPGGTFWLLRYFDAVPTTPKKGDVAIVGGILKYYNGAAWLPFADLTNYYTKAETDEAIDKLAAYYITYNAAGAAFPTRADLLNAQTYYSGGVARVPTRNDYAVVLADETHDGAEYRYIYAVADGATTGQWEAQYPIETNDYTALSNKPQINGNTLAGNKTGEDLGVLDLTGGTMTGGIAFGTEDDYGYLGLAYDDETHRLRIIDTWNENTAYLEVPNAAHGSRVAFMNDVGNAISAIPYALGTPIVIDTASSETVEGETVYYGAATLANRTSNIVQVTAATALDELRITFPAATSGKVRDFGLRVEIGTGSAALAAPALVPIAPTGETIKIENADGTIPELADGTATAKGVTLLYFSETAPGVFVVKGEQVEEVA